MSMKTWSKFHQGLGLAAGAGRLRRRLLPGGAFLGCMASASPARGDRGRWVYTKLRSNG